MANLSLTICSFLLKKRNTQDKYKFLNDELSSINGKTENIEEIFKNFFKEHLEVNDDKDKKRTFFCEFNEGYCGETENFKFIYGIIKSGAYGSSSEIYDNESRKTVYQKGENQTEVRPFYVYVVIPKDSIDNTIKVQKGMLLFQNVGSYGVKTITMEYMKKYFAENYKITVETRSISARAFIEKMINPKNIGALIMNYKSLDNSDNIQNGYGSECRIIGDLNFNDIKWKKIISNILHFTKDKYNLFEFENNTKYNELKLKLKVAGKQRIINMNNLDTLSIIEEIPGDIQMADGHPKRKEMLEHFEKVADDYLKELVLEVGR